jgi:hypothetical protein
MRHDRAGLLRLPGAPHQKYDQYGKALPQERRATGAHDPAERGRQEAVLAALSESAQEPRAKSDS